ncbi:hypothetical protein PQX77_005818 [Marasmius sp. AFHP31]|nr:hypothetical protein PQX77_005818 [Marasmius sp. AFHP31]
MFPIELVLHLLSFFHADEDKETLRSCALVDSSWRQAAQEILFKRLTLKFNNTTRHEDYQEMSTLAVQSYERLIGFLDSNPLLTTYIHNLALFRFEKVPASVWDREELLRQQEKETDTIFRLLKQLKNVKYLKLFRSGNLDGIQAALYHIFQQPALNRVEISFAHFSSIADLLLLLVSARNLEHIDLSNVGFDSHRTLPAEETIKIAPAHTIHPASLHFNLFPIDNITAFFSEPHCPIDFSNLQTLKLHRSKLFDYDTTAKLLSLVGHNLRDLELLGPDRMAEDKDNLHLGYTPNLRSLKLINLRQTVTYHSVPWIQSLFPLSVAEESPITPHLRNISLEVVADVSNSILRAVGPALWTHWRSVDALFSSNTSSLLDFPSLERLQMVVSTPSAPLEPDLIAVVLEQFPELAGAGKFSLETTYWEMAASTALMRLPAISI